MPSSGAGLLYLWWPQPLHCPVPMLKTQRASHENRSWKRYGRLPRNNRPRCNTDNSTNPADPPANACTTTYQATAPPKVPPTVSPIVPSLTSLTDHITEDSLPIQPGQLWSHSHLIPHWQCWYHCLPEGRLPCWWNEHQKASLLLHMPDATNKDDTKTMTVKTDPGAQVNTIPWAGIRSSSP